MIYTLHREVSYSTRKVWGQEEGRGVLRTNTTRPSKCDRTANTVRRGQGLGDGGRGKREFVVQIRGGRKKLQNPKLEIRSDRWDPPKQRNVQQEDQEKIPPQGEHNKKVRGGKNNPLGNPASRERRTKQKDNNEQSVVR